MILVDTSVWIDHFRKSNPNLQQMLKANKVCTHPFIIGELACGNLANRSEILTLMQALPHVVVGDDEEVLYFIETEKVYGKGLGYIDIHLITSTLLSKVSIWTKDKKLAALAKELKIHK